MKLYLLILISGFVGLCFSANAQMTVNANQTAVQLVNRLVGSGVVYTNASLTCPSIANGKFQNASTTTVAMDSGIVLTTGSALNVNSVATVFSNIDNFTTGGDAILQAAASGTIFDLCKLEFDFVPIGDTIKFNYRFGSEEYPGFTCSNFNDIFSFFISGPGYPVPKNVALIPGTNCPVSINTVNSSNANPCGNIGSPCAPPNNTLFINSAGSSSVVYSGMTQKITAYAAVTPCSTYHMKFAIADVFDSEYDSGVFLQANSFVSEAATISNVSSTNSTGAPNPFTIEGCLNAVVTITRPVAKPFPQNIALSFTGTATSGLDYVAMPNIVTIPANSTTVSFNVNSLGDAITEGTENIKIYVYGALCTGAITDSVLIDIFEYPTYNVSNNDTICLGQNANMNVTQLPLNANQTFNWTANSLPLGTGLTLTSSPTSTTSFIVTSIFPGCPPKDSIIMITVEPLSTISLTPTDVSCNGLGNGSILANGNTTFLPLTYTLQSGGNISSLNPTTFSNLNVGTYTVTVTSSQGCTNSATTTIAQPMPLIWSSITQINLGCNQPNSGQILATTSGGTPNYSYSILPNIGASNQGNFTGLNLGNYTITATDSKNCSITTLVNLTQPVGPIFNNNTSTPVSCNGGNNGSIQVNATSNNGGMNYTLLPSGANNTSGSFSGLIAGNYTIVASDASVCTSSIIVIVNEPSSLIWALSNKNDVSCNGFANGTIDVLATGGIGAISYTLNPGAQQNAIGQFINLSPNIYSIIASDVNGCSINTTISILQPQVLQIINIVSNATSCLPGNDGSLVVNAIGGNAPLTYSVNGTFSTSNNISNLPNGNYTITVQDSKGCTVTGIAIVDSPLLPSINSVITTNASCVPGCDGTASVNVTSGSSSSLTYSLDGVNFQSSNQFNLLCALNFSITIKDGNNCTATSAFVITGLNSPSISNVSQTNILCNGQSNGSIQVSSIGGTNPITYNLLPNSVANFSGNFNGLNVGSYTIIASDANGCVVSTTMILNEPPLLQIDSISVSNVDCFNANNGSMNVFASGGIGNLIYSTNPSSIFNPNNSFINLFGNTNYVVTITDSNLCFASSNQFISQPSIISIVSSSATNITCNNNNDGIISVVANGGTGQLNYQLLPTNANNITGNFTNLSSGNYTINITDANGCSISTTLQISNPSPLIQTLFNTTNITCNNQNNGSIQFGATGGTGIISYTLLPGNIINTNGLFQNLSANVYTIIATDINNCTISNSSAITNPPLMQVVNISSTDLLCSSDSNGTISLLANGGIGQIIYSISPTLFSNVTGIFNNLYASNYILTATDANSCVITTNAIINSPPSIIGNLSTQNVVCHGQTNGSIQITGSGGVGQLNYNLLPNNIMNQTGIFNNISGGNYSVVITDSNGCEKTFNPIIITEPNSILFTLANAENVICNGNIDGKIQVITSGGFGGIVFSISPNIGMQNVSGNFTNLGIGTYTITATDANACSASTVLTVQQNPSLLITNLSTQLPKCFNTSDGIISIQGSGGLNPLSYQINGGPLNVSGVFQNLNAGNYIVSITDMSGCQKDTTITLLAPNPIQIVSLNLVPIKCVGNKNGAIEANAIGGNLPLTYKLFPLNINNTNGLFTSLSNGIYTLSIIDSSLCQLDTVIDLKPPVAFQVSLIHGNIGCYGFGNEAWAEAFVQGGLAPYSYNWNTIPPLTTSRIDSLIFGNYKVKIVDENGCEIIDSVFIEPGLCCQEMYIPNAFSPNQDGNNDVFRIVTAAGIEIKKFAVFDRWGKKVWSTQNQYDAWDGMLETKPADVATYYYLLQYKCLTDMKEYEKMGDVILIR